MITTMKDPSLNNYHQSKIALGGEVTLNLVSKLDIKSIDKIYLELWSYIDNFEIRFSRFKHDSELSRFNRGAGTKQYVGQEFIDILMVSKKYYEITKGLFNPFILPALQKAGYNKSFVNKSEDNLDDFSKRAVIKANLIKLGSDWAMIPYGSAIDFGGIGKGYLADKLTDIIKNYDVEGYWLSLGGDIVVNGVSSKSTNWIIDIQDATKPKEIVGKLKLPKNFYSGVATSGTIKRKGIHNNKKWHHIIDPRTLEPAITDIKSVTIATKSGIEADILATCAVILGYKKALIFLKEHKVKAALIQYEKDNSTLSLKTVGNLIELNR